VSSQRPSIQSCCFLIDFGASTTYLGDRVTSEAAQEEFFSDSRTLLGLLVSCFRLTRAQARPLLRAIPREGAIMKFVDAWGVQPTYDAELNHMVASLMAIAPERYTRERALQYVSKFVT